MTDFGKKLQEWRIMVTQCRKCRLLPDGKEIDPLNPMHYCHAKIHHDTRNRHGYKSGWATAMLDKSSEPEYPKELLEVSHKSGLLVVLEAPNDDDTYRLDKGYLTCGPDTDETGKRLYRLLQHINFSPEEVVFTNSVQCMPTDRGKGPKVSPQQRFNCHEKLHQLLAIVRPKVVLAFGNNALKELHRFEPIVIGGRPLAAEEVTVGRLVGQYFKPWASTSLVPLYHPGPKVVSSAIRKDGTPGTGRSEDDQKRDIEVVISLISGD